MTAVETIKQHLAARTSMAEEDRRMLEFAVSVIDITQLTWDLCSDTCARMKEERDAAVEQLKTFVGEK